MAYGTDIRADAVLEYLRRLGVELGDATPLLKVWGQRTAIAARNNARGKGGRRFWNDVARSVQVAEVGPQAVRVHAAHVAAAQKEFGGEIRPRTAKALTIPVSDEARGKRASEFESGGRELFVLPSDVADTIGLLGYAEEGGDFHALFVLRTRVWQDAEPWWPTRSEVTAFGMDEAERWAAMQVNA